jgi:hypothetical protein
VPVVAFLVGGAGVVLTACSSGRGLTRLAVALLALIAILVGMASEELSTRELESDLLAGGRQRPGNEGCPGGLGAFRLRMERGG